MAASYSTNVPLHVIDDESQPFDNPSYYNQGRMNRSPTYGYGLNPSLESYPVDEYSPHTHHHGNLGALTIRRHRPGSDDPTLQNFPVNLQPTSDNMTSSLPLNVTIQRHSNTPEEPLIQPVAYPVPVYMNNPAPQYPMYVNPPIQPYPIPQPIQYIPEFIIPPSPMIPIEPIKKPPSPIKSIEPVKRSPSPPPSPPARYQTEVFHRPTPRNNHTTRRPIRTDLITPPPPPPPPVIRSERVRPESKVVVEEYDNYTEYYDVPKKVISYRTVPGMTTREIENHEMDNSKGPLYTKSPKTQTVTYRVS